MGQDLISKGAQRPLKGLYAFAFILVVLCSHVSIQSSKPAAEKKRMCSIESDQPKSLIDVSEMLFSIRGFGISDPEELP